MNSTAKLTFISNKCVYLGVGAETVSSKVGILASSIFRLGGPFSFPSSAVRMGNC